MADPRVTSGLERALGWAVFAISWSVALFRGASGAQWQGDVAALRDQGLAAVGAGGYVSTWVTQLFLLVPLGSRTSRASVGAATLVALAAFCAYRLARPTIARVVDAGPLAALLASTAALTAALGPTWQAEATLGGGAAASLALALTSLVLATEAGESRGATLTPAATQRWTFLALALAALLAESLVAGIAVTLTVAGACVAHGVAPPRPLRLALLAGVLVAALLLAAPSLLRPASPANMADLGGALSLTNLGALVAAGDRRATVVGWASELGLLSLALAALGIAVTGRRAGERGVLLVLVMLPLVELAVGARTGASTGRILHALATSSLSFAAVIGVSEVVRFLRGLDVPMARPAAVLTVVFHMTLAAVVCDEASAHADRSARFAAEEWTDAALTAAPMNAALLVHSAPLSFRLFSAQHVDGERPDTVIVAAPLLSHGALMPNLLPREPDLAPLLRDYALTGRASEFGLSALADARPLLVELDARWDARLVAHLALRGPWLRFVPEALSATERKGDGGVGLGSAGRLGPELERTTLRDTASTTIVGRVLKEHATALSLLGLTEAATAHVEELLRLEPADPFAKSARIRLAHATRVHDEDGVELRDLLRF